MDTAGVVGVVVGIISATVGAGAALYAKRQVAEARRAYQMAAFVAFNDRMGGFRKLRRCLMQGDESVSEEEVRDMCSYLDTIAYMSEQGLICRAWVVELWGLPIGRLLPVCRPFVKRWRDADERRGELFRRFVELAQECRRTPGFRDVSGVEDAIQREKDDRLGS